MRPEKILITKETNLLEIEVFDIGEDLEAKDTMTSIYEALKHLALMLVLHRKNQDEEKQDCMKDSLEATLLIADIIQAQKNRGFDYETSFNEVNKSFKLKINFFDTPVTKGADSAHLN